MTSLLVFITINCALLFLFPLRIFSQGKSKLQETSWELVHGHNLEDFKMATISVKNFNHKEAVSITARRTKKNSLTFIVIQGKKEVYSFVDSAIEHPSLHPNAWFADLNNDGLSDVILELWPGGEIGAYLWSRFLILVQKTNGSFSRIAFNCDGGIPVEINNSVYLEINSRTECFSDAETNNFILSNLYSVKSGQIVNVGESFGYPKFDEQEQLPGCAVAQGKSYYLYPEPGGPPTEYYDK